jgi:hypothetical protein
MVGAGLTLVMAVTLWGLCASASPTAGVFHGRDPSTVRSQKTGVFDVTLLSSSQFEDVASDSTEPRQPSSVHAHDRSRFDITAMAGIRRATNTSSNTSDASSSKLASTLFGLEDALLNTNHVYALVMMWPQMQTMCSPSYSVLSHCWRIYVTMTAFDCMSSPVQAEGTHQKCSSRGAEHSLSVSDQNMHA